MGRTGNRLRLLSALALAIGLVAALAAVGAGGAPPPEEEGEQMALRLHDLPPGFFPLDLSEGAEEEIECDELHPYYPGRRLESFVRRFSPEGCLGYYLRVYRAPLPGQIPTIAGTGVMDAGSNTATNAGFALSGALLAKVVGEPLQEVAAAETVGEGTRLFHWDRVPRFIFPNSHLGSFLVWRSGNVLAAVFASAGSLEASDQIAIELAKRQQAHVLDPTPYTHAERYAREVWLDDPALTFPVYWLGRAFGPGRGLPVLRFQGGAGVPPASGLPGQTLTLEYSRNVHLNSWTRAGWRRFLATKHSRELRTWHCTESTGVEIPSGRATVFAGYRRDFKACPDRPPDRFFAFAYLGDTVTAVNFVRCPKCFDDFRGRYNSLAGMKAVVRGLALRPEPVYGDESALSVAMRRLTRTR